MLADAEVGMLDDIVDIGNFPLCQADPESRSLAATVRAQLGAHGAVTLQGFLHPEAVGAIANDLDRARPHVNIRRHKGTVYARTDLETHLAPDDPRRVELEWDAGHVTRDMIPPQSAAHRLYVSPIFKRFIAACVGRERVFEYADPLAGLVATVLPPGGKYPWHYDTNEFVVTIMIQKPQAGGRFAYCKDLRRPGDENLAGLADVLAGNSRTAVTYTDNNPGDLQLFCGRYSLHQVTPVSGISDRLVLVLSYADRPGVIGPIDRTRSVYGRVTEAHIVASETCMGTDGLIL